MADWVNERDDEDDDSNEPFPFDVDRVNSQTEKAWLLVIDRVEYWLPKSRCELDEDEKVVTIPKWLAYEKGLI